jgi:hypothetical protein
LATDIVTDLVSIMTDEELAVRPNLAEWRNAKAD